MSDPAPVTLDDVEPLVPLPEGDDPYHRAEVRHIHLETQKRQIELNDLAAMIEQRRKYAGRIFVFVSIWMAAIFAVILLDGWSLGGLDISDQVQMTLIGSTTVNVLGILAIVANYFFPKK